MKKMLKVFGIILGFFVLTGCTQNFCSNTDRAEMMAVYETKNIETINKKAEEEGYFLPTNLFLDEMDRRVKSFADEYDVSEAVAKFAGGEINQVTNRVRKQTLWYNYDRWVEEIAIQFGIENTPTRSYINHYKTSINASYSSTTTCITPEDGLFIDGEVNIEGKSWGDAFNSGIIEGLLVYPVAWLLYTFGTMFGSTGMGLFFAILLVTVIVRLFLILITFKQTLAQQKMTALSPKLAEIQAKYPNSNTNQSEKTRMAQEQMDLYKKNNVNPFGMFIVLIFQFPIFIATWGAMSGSAILTNGDIFGLKYSAITLNEITRGNFMAILLFVLMSVAQVVSMKLPQYLQKKKAAKVQKLGKNPAAEKNQKTMNMVSNIMVVMIIVMGLTLPVAMGIYWFIGALISLAQSFIMQAILARKEKPKTAKYKSK